jgi:two-component system cell cycle response regulator
MARKYQTASPSGHTVLVVDDSPDILESTRRLLEAEGHRVLTAPDGATALRTLERERVALILLDYFMPGMGGGEVVRQVRERNRVVQIVLITGYAGEQPARVMMRQLDIQGYHDKSEGAERLLLWVDAALNAYRHARATERHRAGLRFMLDAAPRMYQAQPFEALLRTLLVQVSELQGVDSAFLATLPPEVIGASAREAEGFVAVNWTELREAPLEIRFGTGRFRTGAVLDALPEPERSLVWETLRRGRVEVRGGRSVVPLRLGTRPIGIIYIDRGVEDAEERELLEVFANQAAAAIHNALLSEVATTDSLTGAFVRGFATRRLNECLKSGQRRGEPVSLLMVDVDRFKEINDRHGHYMGDQALGAVAALLQRSVRETDVVGRYGGDEFIVVLPDTPPEGARIVGNRILRETEELALRGHDETISLRLSLGIGTLSSGSEDRDRVLRADDFALAARGLIARADESLYASKRSGGVEVSPPLLWDDVLAAAGADESADQAQDARTGPAPPEAGADREVREPGSPPAPLRLLVVDDEETVRRSLVRYLRRQGHQVTEAADGREALRLLDEVGGAAGYDVILSDLRMPGLSGDQLLLQLQERGDELSRKIIFLSGDEPSGEASRVLAAAGSPVLLKPYALDEISRLVRSCAGRSDGASKSESRETRNA